MSMIAYPLNNIDYSAEDAELFHCTRSSGVFLEDDFSATVTGADNQVTVGQGIAWIRNSRFSGKVLAQKEAVTLDLGLPDSTRPRIDAVIIQFSANLNAASVVVKQGTPASSPVPPEVVQTEALYELHLYHVRRSAGAATVTAGDVTDLRLDSKYCGLMADAAHRIDTSVINAQIDAFIQQLQKRIDGVSDGAMFESSDYPGCYYRVVDGETEWLNPPMVKFREYRTTERYQGKPVYVYLQTISGLNGATGVQADPTNYTSDVAAIVDFGGELSDGSSLPCVIKDAEEIHIAVKRTGLWISNMKEPFGAVSANVWVKYVKP